MQLNNCALILTLALATTSSAFADNIPAGFDQAQYQNLMTLAVQKGEAMQADGLEYRALSHIVPADLTLPRKADYFAVVGGTDSNGGFGILEVTVESENWTIDDQGHWNIEEWNWIASTQGDLSKVDHTLVIETADGTLVDMKDLPVGDASDPAEIARWGAKVIEWDDLGN